MRFLTVIAMIAVASISFADHRDGHKPGGSDGGGDALPTGFLGLTDVLVSGIGNLDGAGMYAACKAQFGVDVKVCDSKDIVDSATVIEYWPTSPDSPDGAWARPHPIGSSVDFTLRNWSGSPISCASSSDARWSLLADRAGTFYQGTCDRPRKVACCR